MQGLKSSEATMIEIMETITWNGNNIDSVTTYEPTNKEDLMNLFKWYSDFTPLISDWLGADATIQISETSIQGTSATYHITVQEQLAITLLDTGANISVILQIFLNPCLKNQNY